MNESIPAGRRAWIVDAIRTPIGRYGRSLSGVRPDDLAAHVLRALQSRQPSAVERCDQVVFGATNQAGEDNRNVARMASLLADFPYEVPAVTVNRLCGSGLEAVSDAVMRVWTGDADCVIAGGVESMSRAPFAFRKYERGFDRRPPEVFDTTIGWRFPNPLMARRFSLDPMGITAENVADKWKIGRQDQDLFALRSQHKAAAAIERKVFEDEIVGLDVSGTRGAPVFVVNDESPRPSSTLESLARLKPVFREGGTVTAGNSSPVNDGAAALLLVSEALGKSLGLEPMAVVVSFASAGVHPNTMGEGPIPAGKRSLDRAGWDVGHLDLVELNEAFAAQSIACVRGLGLDEEIVNIYGGAIALGHPIGCSGARILGTLVHALRREDKERGMAALCIGVGQGIAMCVERR